jgi:hypothetical protein
MRIADLAADCADKLGTKARNALTAVQATSAYLKLHTRAQRTYRVGPNACEFETMKRVIARFRKAARWVRIRRVAFV